MFSRIIKIPIIFEVKKKAFKELDSILKANHLSYEEKILFTSQELFDLYKTYIPVETFSDVIFIKGGNVEEVESVKSKYEHHNVLLIAFGGGSIIDFVKLYSRELCLQYISVPSSLSNDAIYSPIARLTKNGKKESFGVLEPLGIIADIEIIQKSPLKMLLAGVGDLVSNLSAIKDWYLAESYDSEVLDIFSVSLSIVTAKAIFAYTREQLRSEEFVEVLTYGLVLSGLSMIIANSSRPASGAEHLMSHAIDELFPDRATLHGIQVAWAMLYIEKNIRKNDDAYESLLCFFEKIGLYAEIENDIQFSETELKRIIAKAKIMRKRFTVLNII
ncbi:iron-containing alcohol dehydrogenase [Oscillospiraceae bacterium N12]|jgi:glycerol-1-phosphate dehydrogenase [NAD(P)+]|uniref:Iron-containing alcohol dehydrogenase n=1 Tax=Jilunia laotingensis TaxID=2763675 RepID=A0A926FAM1_9BACT|nr:iron-containing alcohol dehydrogenase [Jilunia laotingensis]MBC8594850.1 iron-containing alcohol dehydrogenase [Jilunia laotingensis]